MIFERQKYILALLNSAGGKLGKLDFQKLLFLLCQGIEIDPPYEFVPYKHGGFSFTSYADCHKLTDMGLIEQNERSLAITNTLLDSDLVPEKIQQITNQFMIAFHTIRGDSLLKYVYRTYPYYAIHSEISEELLHGDFTAISAIEAAKPVRKSPGYLTIGYEGRSLEDYLNRLLLESVSILCDVRRNPLSRKYGFAKKTLRHACEGVGIRYEHMPELGIASEKRRGLNSQADYDTLFAEYNRDTLPFETEAIRKICDWIIAGERVALTCYEGFPEQCHRNCVAKAVQQRLPQFGAAIHL